MVIGKKLIKLFLRKGWIYCDPDPVKITEVSIALTLGDWCARYKDNHDCIDPTMDAKDVYTVCKFSGHVDPGEMVICHTDEFVGSTVSWLTPEIRTRSTLACWGFELGTAALWGEPGFHSRWRLEVVNTSSYPVFVRPGTEVGQMMFHLTVGGTKYNRLYNQPRARWRPYRILPKSID